MAGDYLMRQIEDMVRMLSAIIFQRQPDHYSIVSEDGGISAGSLLWVRLKGLLAENRVNEAENLLFATIEAEPRPEYLPVALDFYTQLNSYTNTELAERDFSRQELLDGVAEVKALYAAQSTPEDDA